MAKRGKKAARLAHGSEGRVELGERYGAYDDVFGRRHLVIANVRESATDHMFSRGRIDATHRAAADRFRRLWELAAIGRQRGIDFERAGGSGYPTDPLTDELVRAGKVLDSVIRTLGMSRSTILIQVVGEGRRIEDVAKNWSKAGGIVSGARAEGYVSGTLVDALNDLVKHWRMEAVGAPTRRHAHYTRNGTRVVVNDSICASGAIACTGASVEHYVFEDGHVNHEAVIPVDRGPLMKYVSGNLGGTARKR